MSDTLKTAKIIKSTLSVRWCGGEWYHLFYDFCLFQSVRHCTLLL